MLDTRTYDIEVTELMSEIRYDLRGRFVLGGHQHG